MNYEPQMILLESQRGNRKRMVARVYFDDKGPLVKWRNYEYRVVKTDVRTGFLIFKRPKKEKKA